MFAWGRAVRRRRAKQAAWNDSGPEEQGSEQVMEWSPAMGGVQLEGEDCQEAAKRPRRPEINSGPESTASGPGMYLVPELAGVAGRQEATTGPGHRK